MEYTPSNLHLANGRYTVVAQVAFGELGKIIARMSFDAWGKRRVQCILFTALTSGMGKLYGDRFKVTQQY